MGFVKIPHDLRNWGWEKEPIMSHVYLMLMLDAAWSETEYRGEHIKRGQAVISQREYAKEIGITYQELRTALKRLTAAHRIAQSATRRNTVVTLLDYDCDTQSSTRVPTDDQHDSNAPLTHLPY